MDLTTETRVRDRFALKEDDGIVAAITAAILGVSPFFEQMLNTTFDLALHEDIFFLDAAFHRKESGFYILRTKAGFIVPGTVTLYYGDSLKDAREATIPIPGDELLILDEKGFISVPDAYEGKFLKVSYTAGFDDVDDLPDWLQEAAVSYCGILMTHHQVGDEKAELTTIIKSLKEHVAVILQAHVRTKSAAINPIS